MKRIYLSGPMTGIAEFNHPAFHAEALRLRSLGYDVVNPAELNPDVTASWHECLRKDLQALLTCEAIALMDGWQDSNGVHLEMHVAHWVGMKIMTVQELA